MELRRILDESGVSAAEFAALCGVSKNMVYKWIRGSNPSPQREDKVSKILRAISLAVKDGHLPLAGTIDIRSKQIQVALITSLKRDLT